MTNSRATCRAGHRCDVTVEGARLRHAFHCQFVHAAKPLEKLAELEGINAHTLAAMVNPDRDDVWLPSRRLTSLLERTADHDALARFIAHRSLGFFFRPPSIVDVASTALVNAIAEQTRELSDAVSAIDRALRTDGGITVDEIPGIDREIDDIVEAALRLKATVRRSALPAPPRPRMARRAR